jgi:copper oxidase (laccase) domain-containing protein
MHKIVLTSSSRTPQLQVKHESFVMVVSPSNTPKYYEMSMACFRSLRRKFPWRTMSRARLAADALRSTLLSTLGLLDAIAIESAGNCGIHKGYGCTFCVWP